MPRLHGGQVRYLNGHNSRPVSFWYLPVEDALGCFAGLGAYPFTLPPSASLNLKLFHIAGKKLVQFPFNIPVEREFDAAGFGVNAVDHLIVVPEYPDNDSTTQLIDHALGAGGQTASAIVALQRLGVRTAYAGRFGSDPEGSFGLQSLKDEGVDVEFAEVMEGARTQVGYIIIEAKRGERTVIWDRDELLAYATDDAPVELVGKARVIHIDSHDPPACARMARAARAAGTIVSADIDNVYEGLPELLPLIDVLISSKEFPRLLTGVEDPRAALIEIKARYGCALVGLTKGGRGATVLCEGEFLETPAFQVPGGCVDT
ncbi:MAG: PfkB family carbohydrate kinase, partial [Acidobacteriota bacterium]|nr:PfkB family carbohydrate kinase [Acidobacteriota bacterium]